MPENRRKVGGVVAVDRIEIEILKAEILTSWKLADWRWKMEAEIGKFCWDHALHKQALILSADYADYAY